MHILKPDKMDFAWFLKGNVVVSTKLKVWNKPHLCSSAAISFGTLMSVNVFYKNDFSQEWLMGQGLAVECTLIHLHVIKCKSSQKRLFQL